MFFLTLFAYVSYLVIKHGEAYTIQEMLNTDQAILISISNCFFNIKDLSNESPCSISHFSRYLMNFLLF